MPSLQQVQRTALTLATKNKTFVVYLVIGGVALLVELAAYILLTSLGVRLEIGNAVGMGLGMLTSFGLNCRVNFQVSDRLLRRFASFVIVTLVSYIGSTLLLVLLVRHIGLDPVVAKIITLPLVLVLQFSVNRRITFHSIQTEQ